jgi:hypothetical protein
MTERQIAVLRWIGDGSPVGPTWGAPNSERITAGALRNRGFVTTTGGGPTWSALITRAGREHLALIDGPNPPTPRGPNQTSAYRMLIENLVEAGGTLRVPGPGRRLGGPPVGTVDYERHVATAERRGAVPPGKRIVISNKGDERQLDLVDAPEGAPTEVLPVPVPGQVKRYHRVVVAYRNDKSRHEVSRAQLSRVSRNLQGLVIEAERRGITVAVPEARNDYDRGPIWDSRADGHLGFTMFNSTIAVRVHEDGINARRTSSARETGPCGFDGYTSRLPAYDRDANGLVRISVVSPSTSSKRQSSWSDGKTQQLEDLLPAVLTEIQARSADEREIVRRRKEADAERHREWEAAMAEARIQHAEHHRADVLAKQVGRWQEANDIRAYCDAIDEQLADDADAAEWVAWAREYARRRDPIAPGLRIPTPSEGFPVAELQPFLKGRNPYGSQGFR